MSDPMVTPKEKVAQLEVLLQVVERQRNDALNESARLRVSLAFAEKKIAEIEQSITETEDDTNG